MRSCHSNRFNYKNVSKINFRRLLSHSVYTDASIAAIFMVLMEAFMVLKRRNTLELWMHTLCRPWMRKKVIQLAPISVLGTTKSHKGPGLVSRVGVQAIKHVGPLKISISIYFHNFQHFKPKVPFWWLHAGDKSVLCSNDQNLKRCVYTRH